MQAIRRSAEAQKELIEDLLDMSRITSGNLRLQLREIHLEPVLREAVDSVLPAATAKGVTVDVQAERETDIAAFDLVLADPDRLRQVIWNLLSNAVKFTSSSGQVTVSLRRNDDHVQICVSDTGRGIDSRFLPYIFDRFRQAEPVSTRSQGGLGLGLAISRQLVELHGGSITAESAGVGEGATFTVQLPLPKLGRNMLSAARSNRVIDGGPGANLTGLRILLVEDEQDTRDALIAILQQAGALVTATESAAEALRAFEGLRPDLIVSDIGLPGEDGYALIQRIRAIETSLGSRTTPVPAIALTAFAREEDRRRALKAGFQHHVGKPIPSDELLALLREVGAAQ